jgi:hypothetical protein
MVIIAAVSLALVLIGYLLFAVLRCRKSHEHEKLLHVGSETIEEAIERVLSNSSIRFNQHRGSGGVSWDDYMPRTGGLIGAHAPGRQTQRQRQKRSNLGPLYSGVSFAHQEDEAGADVKETTYDVASSVALSEPGDDARTYDHASAVGSDQLSKSRVKRLQGNLLHKHASTDDDESIGGGTFERRAGGLRERVYSVASELTYIPTDTHDEPQYASVEAMYSIVAKGARNRARKEAKEASPSADEKLYDYRTMVSPAPEHVQERVRESQQPLLYTMAGRGGLPEANRVAQQPPNPPALPPARVQRANDGTTGTAAAV